jgi:hypothetical protein
LALRKFRGQSRQSIVVVVSPSIFDGDIAILDKAGLGKPAFEVEENSAAHFLRDETPRNPTTGIVACCARAVSGHATAVLLKSLMNSRRLMASPAPRTTSGMERISHFGLKIVRSARQVTKQGGLFLDRTGGQEAAGIIANIHYSIAACLQTKS